MNLNVLVLDIETAPIEAYVWKLGEQHLNLSNIKKDSFIMAWSAKWLKDPPRSMIYRDQRNTKDIANDKAILQDLWQLLNKADVVVTQNGEAFDEPRIQARMIYHGFMPYKPVKHHDTYKQLKNKGFTSHKLEYLTDKLCTKYKKLKHRKFPGMSLWSACLNGNKDAWSEMEKYNKYDVLSTEELYLRTRGWSNSKAPAIIDFGDPERQCRYCGALSLTKQGYDRTPKHKYQQMQCQGCGKWQRGKEIKEAA